jgi:hypothetical protein
VRVVVKEPVLGRDVSSVALVVLIHVMVVPLLDTSLGGVIPFALGAVHLPIPVRGVAVIFLFPPSLHQRDRRRSVRGSA